MSADCHIDEPRSIAVGGTLSGARPDFESPAVGPKRRLRMGAVWVVLTRTLGVGVTMLVNIVLARWLTPSDFGNFLLLSSVLALASVLAMLGLNTALVRYVAESLGRKDIERARQSLRLVTAIASISIVSVAGLFALVFSLDGGRLLRFPTVTGLVPMAVTSLVLLSVLQLIAEACRSLHEIRLASFSRAAKPAAC